MLSFFQENGGRFVKAGEKQSFIIKYICYIYFTPIIVIYIIDLVMLKMMIPFFYLL